MRERHFKHHTRILFSFAFGNVIYGWDYKAWAADNGVSDHGTRFEGVESKRAKIDAPVDVAKQDASGGCSMLVKTTNVEETTTTLIASAPNSEEPAATSDASEATTPAYKSKTCPLCGKETGTRCIVRDCDCVKMAPDVCVICMGKASETQTVANGDPSSGLTDGESFDFK